MEWQGQQEQDNEAADVQEANERERQRLRFMQRLRVQHEKEARRQQQQPIFRRASIPEVASKAEEESAAPTSWWHVVFKPRFS
jgi:hypothetical protein